VTQLNNKINGTPACFLGSNQKDATVERDALEGKYKLIYLTPEKLNRYTTTILFTT
jgi:superfamily II DNA helicase RecQ